VRLKLLGRLLAVAALCLPFASYAQAEPVYVSRDFSQFGTVDVGTGVYTEIATTSVQLDALTFAPNGTLYGMGTDNHLYTVDPASGGLTNVGPTGTFFPVTSLAARKDGAVFGDDPFGMLFRVNLLTGTAAPVGGSGVSDLHRRGTLAFGPGDTLFIIIGNSLYTQDQNTGAATPVGATPLDIAFPGGLVFADGQAFAFDFFGKIFTIDTGTGTDSWTGVTVSGGFGAFHGAAVQPQQLEPVAVPEPSGFMLFLVGVGVPAGRLFLRRRRQPAAGVDQPWQPGQAPALLPHGLPPGGLLAAAPLTGGEGMPSGPPNPGRLAPGIAQNKARPTGGPGAVVTAQHRG
jgi:hypothetical protein